MTAVPPRTSALRVQGEPWASALRGHEVDMMTQQADQQRLMLERFQAEVGWPHDCVAHARVVRIFSWLDNISTPSPGISSARVSGRCMHAWPCIRVFGLCVCSACLPCAEALMIGQAPSSHLPMRPAVGCVRLHGNKCVHTLCLVPCGCSILALISPRPASMAECPIRAPS